MTESKAKRNRTPLTVGQLTVEPGQRKRGELQIARLPTGEWMSLPLAVLNGRYEGPKLWLSAGIHGDEVNGVEVILEVLEKLDPRRLHGAIIAVPIVNVFGTIAHSRYLPDRRDLNRAFPGSARGSLAGQIAHLIMTQVVAQCQYGIDLHSGSDHRYNLPQVRADLTDPETRRLAEAFGPPVLMQSKRLSGSIRSAAIKRGAKVLLYEGGGPFRFQRWAIDPAVDGIMRVMVDLGMHDEEPRHLRTHGFELGKTRWARAGRSGLIRMSVEPGDWVTKSQTIGEISSVFGYQRSRVSSPMEGVVIGISRDPVVYRGEAVVHIGGLIDPNNPKDRDSEDEEGEGE